ncbi:MAG: prevent-host-death protein [bacterium]|nr:prevent-host-death protein [bacterium]
MDWKIAQAKQRLSEVIRAAGEEPQRIFNRDRLVAALVDGETFEEFDAWRRRQERRSIGDDFAELRALCAAEDYELPVVEREDRANPFAEALDDEAL